MLPNLFLMEEAFISNGGNSLSINVIYILNYGERMTRYVVNWFCKAVRLHVAFFQFQFLFEKSLLGVRSSQGE